MTPNRINDLEGKARDWQWNQWVGVVHAVGRRWRGIGMGVTGRSLVGCVGRIALWNQWVTEPGSASSRQYGGKHYRGSGPMRYSKSCHQVKLKKPNFYFLGPLLQIRKFSAGPQWPQEFFPGEESYRTSESIQNNRMIPPIIV